MQSMHSVQGSYGVQGGMPSGRPGMGGLPSSAAQQQQQQQQMSIQQGRFGGNMNMSGLQQMSQYGQVQGRMGMASAHPGHPMNGLNGSLGAVNAGNAARGGAVGVNAGLASARGPGMDRTTSAPTNPGHMSMGAAGASGNLMNMRPGANQASGINMTAMNNQSRVGNMQINQLGGQLANLNLQSSHVRSNSATMGVPGMAGVGGASNGPPFQNPSGDLLALMGNKPGAMNAGALGNMLSKGDGSHPIMGGQLGGLGAGGEPDQPVFGDSDFPSLGGGGGPAQDRLVGQDEAGHLGFSAADPYSLSSLQKAGTPHSEFSIQTEDFPALPSASSNFPLPGGEDMAGNFQHGAASIQHGGAPPSSVGYEQQMLWNQQQQQQQQQQHAAMQQQQQPGGHQLLKGAGSGKGAAAGGPDRFGLLGLLGVIRMTDQDLTTLALGTDLTTLGLNLNSPESLYKTFGSPWADAPSRPEAEFQVPSCYLHLPPRLQPGYFGKFQQETLFYIFYSMPGDEAQLLAADELANRGWWYHKEMKTWIRRIPNTETTAKSDRFERSSFYVFDPTVWDITVKEGFGLSYDALERAPNLVRTRPQPGVGGMQPPPPAPK